MLGRCTKDPLRTSVTYTRTRVRANMRFIQRTASTLPTSVLRIQKVLSSKSSSSIPELPNNVSKVLPIMMSKSILNGLTIEDKPALYPISNLNLSCLSLIHKFPVATSEGNMTNAYTAIDCSRESSLKNPARSCNPVYSSTKLSVLAIRPSTIMNQPATLRSHIPVQPLNTQFIRYKSTLIQTKVTSFIKNILKQESAALTDSFNRNLISVESEDDIFIHPKLKSDLLKILDNNNKLFVVLTYNPILIDPKLYLLLYEKLDSQIDTNLKVLLFKRLLFLQEYKSCWKIVLETYTSITDIEEFLDLAYKSFEENDDLDFGPFNLLLECYQDEGVSQTIKNFILETVQLKYGGKKAFEESFEFGIELKTMSVTQMQDGQAEQAGARNAPLTEMLYLKKRLSLVGTSPEETSSLIANLTISKYSGWLTLISPKYNLSNCLTKSSPPLICQIISKTINLTSPNLNTQDVLYALNSKTNLNPYLLYLIYINRYLNTKRVPNRYIINHLFSMILENGINVQIRSVLFENWKICNEDLVVRAMVNLYRVENDTDFYKFFNLLNKEPLVEKFITKMDKNTRIPRLKKLIDNCYTSRFSKAIRLILKSVTLDSHSAEEITEFHTTIINDYTLRSKQILLECFRCLLLRTKLINQEIMNDLLDRLLHVSLPPNKILKRANSTDPKFNYDIQRLLHLATTDEKAQFHNMIRSMGQTISVLENPSAILNTVNIAVNSNSMVRSTYGRQYLISSLITETVRFIERKNPRCAILKVRDIKAELNFKSNIDSCLFKLIVQDRPQNAFQIINTYKLNKKQLSGLLEHMISGILASTKLDKSEKFIFLDQFLKELKRLGYDHRLRQLTGYEILNVLSDESSKLLDSSKVLALNMMKSNKTLHRPVMKNLKKVRM